jgi:hypothetical protein
MTQQIPKIKSDSKISGLIARLLCRNSKEKKLQTILDRDNAIALFKRLGISRLSELKLPYFNGVDPFASEYTSSFRSLKITPYMEDGELSARIEGIYAAIPWAGHDTNGISVFGIPSVYEFRLGISLERENTITERFKLKQKAY